MSAAAAGGELRAMSDVQLTGDQGAALQGGLLTGLDYFTGGELWRAGGRGTKMLVGKGRAIGGGVHDKGDCSGNILSQGDSTTLSWI